MISLPTGPMGGRKRVHSGVGLAPMQAPSPWRHRASEGSLALVVMLTVLLPLPMSYAQQPVELHVSTGQQLADAVAVWGASGSNMTIYIDVDYISLRTANFTSYPTTYIRPASASVLPFSQGTLTIRGRPGGYDQPTTILDAGMKFGLIPTLVNSARYSLEDVIVINSCDQQHPFVTAVGKFTVTPPTPFGITLFGQMTLAYQSQRLTNVICYGRLGAMNFQLYSATMQATRVPELRARLSPLVNQASGLPVKPFDELTTHVRGTRAYSWTLGAYFNYTLKSLTNPNDTLLDQLRREGKMMPPQHCSGTLLTPERATVEWEPDLAPIQLVDDQPGFVKALDVVVRRTAVQPLIQGPPVALMLGKGQVEYSVPDGVVYPISSMLLVSGVTGWPVASDDLHPWLNLKGRSDVFQLQPGVQLVFQILGLTGLAVHLPTQLPPGLSADTLQTSVFPLAAVKTALGPETWRNFSSVVINNCTLSIPAEDYLALVLLGYQQAGQALPASSCADTATMQRVLQWQAGLVKLRMDLPVITGNVLNTPIYVDQFQGLGINGSMVRILPATPVQLPTCSGNETPIRSIAMTVGLAVGIPLILLGGVAVCMALHRRRQQQQSSGVTSPDKAGAPLPGSQSTTPSASTVRMGTSTTSGSELIDLSQPPSNAAQLSSNRWSALISGVQQARADHQRLLDSVSTTADQSGQLKPSVGHNATYGKGLSLPEMQEQIEQLAAQLDNDKSDKLVIAGLLGAGTGGTVFCGLWKGMQVAVKTMIYHDVKDTSKDGPDQQASQPRALMEAAIAASVGHPNLVATYRYDIKALKTTNPQQGSLQIKSASQSDPAEGTAYKVFLIQELCDASLADGIRNRLLTFTDSNQLDMDGALLVLLDIAKGLMYLHSNQIIHADLKPENILLKLHASVPHGVIAKLTDFGISTKLSPGATHVSNFKMGSPFYVAPEVIHKHQSSPASDLYSFGIIMWEAASQARAFTLDVQGRQVPNPSFPSFPPQTRVPNAFDQLFRRCCAVDPKQRPSANEVYRTLWRILIDVRNGALA